jgi:hypothetical protein
MKTEEKQIQKDYPRTYQMDKSTRSFVHWFGIFLVVFFLGMTPLHLFGVMKNPMPPLTLALTDVLVIVSATWPLCAQIGASFYMTTPSKWPDGFSLESSVAAKFSATAWENSLGKPVAAPTTSSSPWMAARKS